MTEIVQLSDAMTTIAGMVGAVMALAAWQARIVHQARRSIEARFDRIDQRLDEHERIVADAFAREGLRGPDGWPTSRQRRVMAQHTGDRP